MSDEEKPRRWWNTLPGRITGLAAMVTALTTMIVAIKQTDWFDHPKPPAVPAPPLPDQNHRPAPEVPLLPSPTIQQAPNSRSDITYTITNQIVTGADPRDVAIYLHKLTTTSKNDRYEEIDEFYTNRQISAELKDTLYTVIDYIDQNLQSSNRQINQLQSEGKTQTASTLESVDSAFADSDINKLIAISNDAKDNPDITDPAISINLADKFVAILRYTDAENNYKTALSLLEKQGMQTSVRYAVVLNKLGKLYLTEQKYSLAEPKYKRTLEILNNTTGINSYDYASNLTDIALLYYYQGKYDLAEPLYQQALEIRRKTGGINSADYAVILNNLAISYYIQNKYEPAEPLYKEAVNIRSNSW